MKKLSSVIALLIAVVMLVAGVALTFVGVSGQNTYNQVAQMLGCKKPDAINYVLDPSLIDAETLPNLDAAATTKFMTGVLGQDEAAVKTAIENRTSFSGILEQAGDKEYFNSYAMEKGYVQNEDELKALRKDKEKVAEIESEIIAALASEQLGLDAAAAADLAGDVEYKALMKDGLTKLYTSNGFTTTKFNKSTTFLFLGVACLVVAGAILLIMWMSMPPRANRKGKKQNEKLQKFGTFLLNNALFIILFVVLAVVCIIRPDFLRLDNILNILKQSSTKGILALGCAGLIVLAGTDLSIGRVLGLSAAVTASLVQAVDYSARMFPQMTRQLPLFIPLLASISVAVIFALINGFGVAKLKLHAFIITLGTQLIAQGCTCIYIESQPSGTAQALSTFDRNFLNTAAGNLSIGSAKIPLVVIYFAVIAFIMWVIWNKTRLGKNMFAVGGNMEAAAVSGVNVAMTIMLVYLIAGILYGTSAFLEAARITSVGANTGLNYETDAISACVVGGVSFSGGVGTIQGVVIGAVILQAINYALQFLGVNPYLQYIVRGLIIILAVSIDVRKYIVKK